MTLAEGFYSKTATDTGCILWVGATNSRGYGCFAVDGVSQLAHRVAYADAHGPIPADMTVDHLCRVKQCVNPEHMELVTRGENVKRAALLVVGGTCGRGHDIGSELDIYVNPRGRRECRSCRRVQAERSKATA